ncbi:MAG: PEFG-CTERM sorting domain-containing protein [Nitrosopumilaceae archaeon]|nr:PEFG-CTERM sorting domain-containing protein [Nitrosopumilaceae archaeon]NDB88442.1 PEFG-CTERM sorting domain-containing protein [Nitrososphaerota archaeon]NDF26576.1 PEFG-CTERM sorting domain-containing protein [Nitrosopumilaceae archaeon]NDF35626.1 PEFG-CTERM sorting domain-containing protein [Nitrosopumilaceae archaeon]NDF47718.1 PEFG-CTERM sorting domain-containing protein [Nitrosopumilaceae archaeon]
MNNTGTQVLTIYNFQTEDNPFLGGNSTFVVIPNPFAHTTNATDYLDLTTWFNFVVTDDGKFDSDPTPGIIEIVGVNNGTYSVMQIKGSSGYGLAQYPEASDEIFGTTGFAYVTQTFVNFTGSTSTTIEPPQIDDATLNKLKNTGGAKINGVSISNANDLPPAKVVTVSQILTATPPDHVVFTQTFSPSSTPSTLINNLGIPTYSPPTSLGSSSAFMPPVYVAPVSSGGGNFIMTPVMDSIMPGSNVVIRADKVDQGTDHPLLEAIKLPINTQGTNVGVTVKVNNKIPSGAPSIPSGFVGMYLDFQATGDIDFSDSNTYSEKPTITFTLAKVGSTCPDGVTLYLQEGSHWHSVASSVTPSSTGTHTCTYSVSVDHFSTYLVGKGSETVDHNHDSNSHSSSHDSSDHDSHTSHTHASTEHDMGEPGDHPHEHAIMEITKQLTIYEIQYSLQTGLAQIIVGTTGHADDLEVQIHGRVSGLHTATLAKINPFVVFNKQNHSDMNKYVFEVPIDQSETYFRVSVDDSKYTLAQTVTITGQSGKVVPWYSESAESMDHLVPTEATINPAEYTVKFDGGTKVVSYNNMQFPIKYEMLGGISGLEVDEQSKSVTLLLSGVSERQATIQIPRSLVDAVGDEFVVLVTASPQRSIDYRVVSSTSDSYTLQMDLPDGASSLTIVGTAVVPEFGFIASLIMGLATLPIILVRKKFQSLW